MRSNFFHPSAAQALVDGIVFAVDRQQRFALAAGFGGDQFARRDQAFLVGQPNGLAGLDGFVSGFESGHADNGADHKINVGMSSHIDGSGGAVYDFDIPFVPEVCKRERRISGIDCGGHGNQLGFPAPGLLESDVNILSGGQSDNLKAVRIGLDHAQVCCGQ